MRAVVKFHTKMFYVILSIFLFFRRNVICNKIVKNLKCLEKKSVKFSNVCRLYVCILVSVFFFSVPLREWKESRNAMLSMLPHRGGFWASTGRRHAHYTYKYIPLS